MSKQKSEPDVVAVVNVERISPRQVHVTLSSPITQSPVEHGTEFTTAHVVVSHGSHADTQIFPANEQGAVVDLLSLWGRDNEHVPPIVAVREWLESKA